MELFAERLRLAAQAEATPEGTSELPGAVRVKLRRAWQNSCRELIADDSFDTPLNQSVREQLEVSLGFRAIIDDPVTLLEYARDTPFALSVVEAMYQSFNEPGLVDGSDGQAFFASEVNRIFVAHRIAFTLHDGIVVPVSSFELHDAVVAPVLYLLHSRADLAKGHTAYMKAVQEIRNNDPGDAITDAGTHCRRRLRRWAATGVRWDSWSRARRAKVCSVGTTTG